MCWSHPKILWIPPILYASSFPVSCLFFTSPIPSSSGCPCTPYIYHNYGPVRVHVILPLPLMVLFMCLSIFPVPPALGYPLPSFPCDVHVYLLWSCSCVLSSPWSFRCRVSVYLFHIVLLSHIFLVPPALGYPLHFSRMVLFMCSCCPSFISYHLVHVSTSPNLSCRAGCPLHLFHMVLFLCPSSPLPNCSSPSNLGIHSISFLCDPVHMFILSFLFFILWSCSCVLPIFQSLQCSQGCLVHLFNMVLHLSSIFPVPGYPLHLFLMVLFMLSFLSLLFLHLSPIFPVPPAWDVHYLFPYGLVHVFMLSAAVVKLYYFFISPCSTWRFWRSLPLSPLEWLWHPGCYETSSHAGISK